MCFIFWEKSTQTPQFQRPPTTFVWCQYSLPLPSAVIPNSNYCSQNSYATSKCFNLSRSPWHLSAEWKWRLLCEKYFNFLPLISSRPNCPSRPHTQKLYSLPLLFQEETSSNCDFDFSLFLLWFCYKELFLLFPIFLKVFLLKPCHPVNIFKFLLQ